MRICPVAILLLSTVLFLACRQRGPELGNVQGTITLDNRPLALATVIFEPKTGGRASKAITDQKGHYILVYLRDMPGTQIGSHIVKIFTATENDPKERIPARYNKKTTLSVEVGAGTNEHDFNLSSR
jgi:hypothetical protein